MGQLFNVSDTIPPGDRDEAVAFFERILGNSNPLNVELGSGNGHFLAEWAMRHPGQNFVGTEILSGRARKFQSKVDKRGITNLVVFRGDVRRFVWEFLHEEMVEEFIALFPDPWPKKRHHKHRLLSAPFIRMLRGRLTHGGVVTVATDSVEYREFILSEFEEAGGFRSLFHDGFGEYPSDYPETLFFKRFKAQGWNISYMRFEKADENTIH